jgi:hypothetical protein
LARLLSVGKKVESSSHSSPEDLVEAVAGPAAQLVGGAGERAQVVVADVAAVDAEHLAVGVDLVRVGQLRERAVLDLAARRDLLELVGPGEPVGRHLLEVVGRLDPAICRHACSP